MGGFLATLLGLFGQGPAKAQQGSSDDLPIDEASVIASIGYQVVTVQGKQALTEWQKLRDEGKGYPVIVGNTQELANLVDGIGFNDGRSPDEVIRAASSLSFPNAILEKRRLDMERFAKEFPSYADQLESRPEIGEWPDRASPSPGLTVHTDMLSGKLFERVHIVVVPTDRGYEVPAYLAFGGWNENPAPEYHVAALRSWQERYGTELIGISNDVLNLKCTQKPASREEALALAKEHYAYCADIVDQGVGNIAELAASYLADDWWYFWWD